MVQHKYFHIISVIPLSNQVLTVLPSSARRSLLDLKCNWRSILYAICRELKCRPNLLVGITFQYIKLFQWLADSYGLWPSSSSWYLLSRDAMQLVRIHKQKRHCKRTEESHWCWSGSDKACSFLRLCFACEIKRMKPLKVGWRTRCVFKGIGILPGHGRVYGMEEYMAYLTQWCFSDLNGPWPKIPRKTVN